MKAKRHKKIMDIIETQEIETQDELTEELFKRGICVTQATISRDIKELSLVKIPVNGKYCYALPNDRNAGRDQRRIQRLFKDSVTDIDFSENLILVRTLPGGAPSVASAIDTANFSEVIGTVAGDDTILVIVKPKEAVGGLIDKFNSLLD